LKQKIDAKKLKNARKEAEKINEEIKT